ncbi:MAG: FAD-dependent monooxygenase, partial [Hyphomicrobiales bacterium]
MAETLLIAGGGIAGLATALAVAKAGYEAAVFEQADELQEFGAGMQLGPNAAHALVQLGIGKELNKAAGFPEEVRILDGITGRTLNTVRLGEGFEKTYGAPYRVIHRGDLLDALAKACAKQKRITINLSSPVSKISIDDDVSVTVKRKKISGSALVGADGIRSFVRSELVNDGGPELSGQTIGRALIPAEIMPVPESAVHLWMLPGGHVVHYPIRGGKAYNLVAAYDAPWEDEGWNAPATKDEIETWFEDCTGVLRQVLAAAPEWRKWAGADRAPGTAWGVGPATLVGDAAHGVLPYLAQGAAMALEDAATLGNMLSDTKECAAAFRAYEALRQPRTERLYRETRAAGQAYHAGGATRLARNMVLRTMS